MLMDDFRYKIGLKNAIHKKGLYNRPIPGKLKDDRFGEIQRRNEDLDERPVPGKLSDDRFSEIPKLNNDDTVALPAF